ncbi:MAG: general stress protein [Paenisporosarcina sp.]
MDKRVVGIYNSQAAVLLEIDKLKALGHDEDSIFVLAKDLVSASSIAWETGVQLEEIPEEGEPEPKDGGLFSKVFYALDYETQHSGVAAVLKSAGITSEEVGTYVRRLEQGDLVLLASADAPRQPYSDESDAGFGNEEQSMKFYDEAVKSNPGFVPVSETRRPIVTSGSERNHDQESTSLLKDEIYVEHILFEDEEVSVESTDEELYRVPIFEERVKVMKEKVLTGEIVVRRRK